MKKTEKNPFSFRPWLGLMDDLREASEATGMTMNLLINRYVKSGLETRKKMTETRYFYDKE